MVFSSQVETILSVFAVVSQLNNNVIVNKTKTKKTSFFITVPPFISKKFKISSSVNMISQYLFVFNTYIKKIA